MGLLLTSAALGVEANSAGGWTYAGWGITLKELLAAGKSEVPGTTITLLHFPESALNVLHTYPDSGSSKG
jgi:hypothetical protein